jgi:hypothetical protein
MLRRLLVLSCLVLAASGVGLGRTLPAHAAGANVLVLSADCGNPDATLVGQIGAQPGISSVTFFDGGSGTPSLAAMETYTGIVALSNCAWADPTAVGNNLAAYESAGGKVVAFNFDWFGAPQSIGGAWMSGGFSPFNDNAAVNFSPGSLGTYDAGSPLMQGVTTLSALYRETVTLVPGAHLVASWDDGSPMIATLGNTVGVSAFVGDTSDHFSGDWGRLIANVVTSAPGTAEVVKTVDGAAPAATQAYTFQLRQGASAGAAGTILESGAADAANAGVIDFATPLTPGTTYALCELIMPGWTTSLGPPLYSVYNPGGDTSAVCTDFSVTAGQILTFDVDNTPPPGVLALGIGYWKNWSACTRGGQRPVLDQTLLAAANAGHPVTAGSLVLNPNTLGARAACQDAVNLLNKSALGGRKMASDPLFNMAAQFLAADLNVQAGASPCPSATAAIDQALALLEKYHFDGNGYAPRLTAADASVAGQAASALDGYNNGALC